MQNLKPNLNILGMHMLMNRYAVSESWDTVFQFNLADLEQLREGKGFLS